MRDRGEVDDRANAVDERATIEFGGDIRDEDLIQLGRNGARRDKPPYRCADRMAARKQRAAKGSTDEARRTGDENAHVRHSACDSLLDLAPCSGQNVANHAAQVPKRISDVASALASCEMHGGGARNEPDVVTRQPEAGTQIHVLVIEVIARVESPYRGKSVPSKQHEHAAYPIRRDAFLADLVVSLRLHPQGLANQA